MKSRVYFLRLYPYLHLLYNLCHLVHFFRYTIGRSGYHSPFNRLAASQIVNLSTDRAKEMEERTGSGVAKAFTSGLSVGLEIGAFFLQFLEWWYSSEGKTRDLSSLPIPAPPPFDPRAESLRGKCPICRAPRKNETLLQPSGYVFCYSCIVKHLRSESTCPVTQYPAKEEHLVRIYGND